MENFKKTLRHTDPMVLDDFGTSLPFIDVYLSTLDNQDSTIYKSVPAHWSWFSDFLEHEAMLGALGEHRGWWLIYSMGEARPFLGYRIPRMQAAVQTGPWLGDSAPLALSSPPCPVLKC